MNKKELVLVSLVEMTAGFLGAFLLAYWYHWHMVVIVFLFWWSFNLGNRKHK